MRIKYLLQNVDMRCNQNGLGKLIQTKKGAVLKENDFVLFLNTKQTMLKLLSWDHKICISYKSGYGRLNPVLFTQLHKYWNGKTINFRKAEHDCLIKSLQKKGRTIKNT